jgi:outer membrane protein TolC
MLVRALLIALFLSRIVLAGNPLTLNEALRRASEQNLEVRLAELEADAADADYRKTFSVFLPRVTLSETVVKTNDPLNTFGFKLKQEAVTMADFNPAILNDPDAITNYSTKAEVQLPLVNLDGLFGRQAARYASLSAQAKIQRTSEYVRLEVKKTYFALVIALRSVDVIDQSIATARSGLEQARQYRSQGLIHQSDVIQAEIRLLDLEAKRLEVTSQTKALSDQLGYLTGIEGDIVPVDTLRMPEDTPLPISFDQVSAQRSDFRAIRAGIDAARFMQRVQRSSLLPSINAFGSYEWNDPTFAGIGANSWMIGVVAKWEIFKGWDQIGELQKAAARKHQAETTLQQKRLQAEIEINAARRELTVAEKKTVLAKESVDQAVENLRIVSDRYDKGLERTTDFLHAQTLVDNARLQYLQALYNYHSARFTLEFLTGSMHQN